LLENYFGTESEYFFTKERLSISDMFSQNFEISFKQRYCRFIHVCTSYRMSK
jgi:hypothetical protein